jgi:hypothetical protein
MATVGEKVTVELSCNPYGLDYLYGGFEARIQKSYFYELTQNVKA